MGNKQSTINCTKQLQFGSDVVKDEDRIFIYEGSDFHEFMKRVSVAIDSKDEILEKFPNTSFSIKKLIKRIEEQKINNEDEEESDETNSNEKAIDDENDENVTYVVVPPEKHDPILFDDKEKTHQDQQKIYMDYTNVLIHQSDGTLRNQELKHRNNNSINFTGLSEAQNQKQEKHSLKKLIELKQLQFYDLYLLWIQGIEIENLILEKIKLLKEERTALPKNGTQPNPNPNSIDLFTQLVDWIDSNSKKMLQYSELKKKYLECVDSFQNEYMIRHTNCLNNYYNFVEKRKQKQENHIVANKIETKIEEQNFSTSIPIQIEPEKLNKDNESDFDYTVNFSDHEYTNLIKNTYENENKWAYDEICSLTQLSTLIKKTHEELMSEKIKPKSYLNEYVEKNKIESSEESSNSSDGEIIV